MKKFIFTLKAVLKMRVRAVDLAKAELGKAVAVLSEHERELAACKEELAANQASYKSSYQRMSDPFEMEGYVVYARKLEENAVVIQDAILHAQSEVAKARSALVKAQQEQKTIENIRDKQYAAWQSDLKREEAQRLDEYSSIRFARTMQNSDSAGEDL